ncbi:MAG TPA: hypothetical protein VHZ51_27560 [Ktedonobacteraceae bacterium]|jgi:DNA-binding NtrC family response regulator|nr:hypothetical protein [Ktedonobacteraceae bacterium]
MEQAHIATVLVVEADHSLRRLMALGLQHRGMRAIEASSPENIPDSAIQQLDMLVLDVDRGRNSDWSCLNILRARPDLAALPTIILGWDCRVPVAAQSMPATPLLVHAACVDKPFDARILHRTIDRLLAERVHAEEQREAEQEAALLASYTYKAAPSIWPLVTAAGLLIVVAGVLLQFAVAVIGFLIVIVALLLWTLESKPSTGRVAVM